MCTRSQMLRCMACVFPSAVAKFQKDLWERRNCIIKKKSFPPLFLMNKGIKEYGDPSNFFNRSLVHTDMQNDLFAIDKKNNRNTNKIGLYVGVSIYRLLDILEIVVLWIFKQENMENKSYSLPCIYSIHHFNKNSFHYTQFCSPELLCFSLPTSSFLSINIL